MRGRLLFGADEPARDVAILLEGSIATGPGSTHFGLQPRMFRTSADGTFAIPGRVTSHSFYLAAVMSPRERARWLKTPQDPPVAQLALLLSPTRAGTDLGDVRLDELEVIDLCITDPDGGIPGSLPIVAIPLGPEGGDSLNAMSRPLTARTDRRGRVRLLACKDAKLAIFCFAKTGAAFALATKGQQQLDLRIDPRHLLRLRLTADGKPVASARTTVVVTEGGSLPGNAPHVLRAVRGAFVVNAFPSAYGTTDADGNVDLVLPVPGASLDLSVSRDGKSMRMKIPWPELEAGARLPLEFAPNGR